MAHVSHERLIRANNGSDEVTHHCCPKNGHVHEGHPSQCSDKSCMVYAAQLMLAETAKQKIPETDLDREVKEDEARQMSTVVAVVIVVVIAIFAGLIWFCVR